MNDPVAHRPEQSPLKGSVVGSTPTGISKLIKALQWAHASELGAYYAYQGHWESLSNLKQIQQIQRIQKDELNHAASLKAYLEQLNSNTHNPMDQFFTLVGKILGYMCKVFGWRIPMIIAGLLERIGKNSYTNMSQQAEDLQMYKLAAELEAMGKIEEQHELYFKNLCER